MMEEESPEDGVSRPGILPEMGKLGVFRALKEVLSFNNCRR